MVSLGPFPYYLGSSRLCAQSPRFFWGSSEAWLDLKKKKMKEKKVGLNQDWKVAMGGWEEAAEKRWGHAIGPRVVL